MSFSFSLRKSRKKSNDNQQADLLDGENEILTSAYYVYVRKI